MPEGAIVRYRSGGYGFPDVWGARRVSDLVLVSFALALGHHGVEFDSKKLPASAGGDVTRSIFRRKKRMRLGTRKRSIAGLVVIIGTLAMLLSACGGTSSTGTVQAPPGQADLQTAVERPERW